MNGGDETHPTVPHAHALLEIVEEVGDHVELLRKVCKAYEEDGNYAHHPLTEFDVRRVDVHAPLGIRQFFLVPKRSPTDTDLWLMVFFDEMAKEYVVLADKGEEVMRFRLLRRVAEDGLRTRRARGRWSTPAGADKKRRTDFEVKIETCSEGMMQSMTYGDPNGSDGDMQTMGLREGGSLYLASSPTSVVSVDRDGHSTDGPGRDPALPGFTMLNFALRKDGASFSGSATLCPKGTHWGHVLVAASLTGGVLTLEDESRGIDYSYRLLESTWEP